MSGFKKILLSGGVLFLMNTLTAFHPGYAQKEEEELPIFYLDEIVVTATRSSHILKDVPIETSLITRKEIEAAGIQTAADAIRWVAGLNISGGAPFGASRRFTSMVRGLPAQYSLVLIDGKRTKSEHIHTGVNMNLIPIDMVERIEVVKGPASALYGSDAMGGVINIITKSIPEKAAFDTDISYGSFNTKNISLSHGFRPGKFGYFLNAKLTDTDGAEENWYKQRNVLSKVTCDLSESDRLNLNARYYENSYLRSGKEVNDDEIGFTLDWKRDIGENSSLKVGSSYCRFTGSRKKCTNITSEADIIYQGIFYNKHFITSGVEIRQEDFKRVSTPQKKETIFSIYVQDEMEVTAPLTGALALRIDNHPKAGTVLTPKASALYRLTQGTNLRASVGRGFRAPSLQDLYEYHYFHRTYWRDGNSGLKPEFSISYNLGIEHKFSKSLLTRISGFRNDFSDMIAVANTGRVENDGLPILERRNIKTAYTQGIETELRYSIADLNTVLGYTFLDTEDDEGKVLSYNPKHLTTFRLYYDIKRIGLGVLLSGENARARYYKDKKGNVEKLGDYTLLNLQMTKRISEHANLFFTVGNILDQKFEAYEEGKAKAGFGSTFTGGMTLRF